VRPETRLVSVTYPHNPTGSTIGRNELEALVALVERHPTARLLVDETYRELAYADPLPMAAGLSPRVVAVSSMSKTYGLPGLRIGWLTCSDVDLMETLLAAKEQIFICGAVLEEELAARVLERRAEVLSVVRSKTQAHLEIVRRWIRGNAHFEWVEPEAGVVGFPRLRPGIDVDLDAFYDALLERHGTYVGPGHWFDQDRRFFRLGFAWPAEAELERGLDALDRAAAETSSA
jgi:aspartate/methionine/tyrosine aminotransferase